MHSLVGSSGSGNQADETPLKTRVIVTFIIQTRLLSEHGGGAINKLPGITGRAGATAGQIRTRNKHRLVNNIVSALANTVLVRSYVSFNRL